MNWRKDGRKIRKIENGEAGKILIFQTSDIIISVVTIFSKPMKYLISYLHFYK